MRLFIASPLLAALYRRVIKKLGVGAGEHDFRFVAPYNLHVTLKFLGETPIEELPRITRVLESAVAGHVPFDVMISGGVLLPPKRPTVLALRIEPNNKLQHLFDSIDTALSEHHIAYREHRQFRPHATIARTRRNSTVTPEQYATLLNNLKMHETVLLDTVILYESILKPEGPDYNPLQTIYLSDKNDNAS